jgi:hypothetical protein
MRTNHTGPVPYALALALTIVVEAPIYAAVIRGARGWLVGVGVNVVTHPMVWWTLSRHPSWFAPVEVGAWLVEAALAWLVVRRDAAVLALTAFVANAASVLAGLLLTR